MPTLIRIYTTKPAPLLVLETSRLTTATNSASLLMSIRYNIYGVYPDSSKMAYALAGLLSIIDDEGGV